MKPNAGRYRRDSRLSSTKRLVPRIRKFTAWCLSLNRLPGKYPGALVGVLDGEDAGFDLLRCEVPPGVTGWQSRQREGQRQQVKKLFGRFLK